MDEMSERDEIIRKLNAAREKCGMQGQAIGRICKSTSGGFAGSRTGSGKNRKEHQNKWS